jgi:hypothetical protein
MDWKTVAGILAAIVVVVAFGMEAYKKNLRGDASGKTRAARWEIILVAASLSVLLTASLGFGLGFPGMPLAGIGYAATVFILQWQLDQNVVKRLWKIPGLLAKMWLRKQGATEKEIGEVDDAG